jgi:hypothetical protein
LQKPLWRWADDHHLPVDPWTIDRNQRTTRISQLATPAAFPHGHFISSQSSLGHGFTMKDIRHSIYRRLQILPIVNRKSVVVILLILCVVSNFVFTWIAENRLESMQSHQSSEAQGSVLAPTHQGIAKPWRKTMAPQESSPTTAGFIHVGKTGGSTISKLLRNGCTSFVAGPCRNITHESIVSKNVVSMSRFSSLCRIWRIVTMMVLMFWLVSL